jgi:hypothetical protein
MTGGIKQEVLNKDIGVMMKHSSTETKNIFKTLAHSALNESKHGGEHDVAVSNGVHENHVSINTFPIMSVDNKISGCAFVLTAPGKKESIQETSTDKTLFNFLENAYSNNSFFVKKDARFIRVGFKEILWIEALDNYIVIKTTSKEQFILHSSMKEIEARLPLHDFIRIHRSYIVQLEKIAALEGDSCFIDGNRVPIGKAYRENLNARINLL